MNNTNDKKNEGYVQNTDDVININAIDPDGNREKALETTDFAEALSKEDENNSGLETASGNKNAQPTDKKDESKED